MCVPSPEICDNGIDDDCDTLVDCVDETDCLPTVPPCRIRHDPSTIRFGSPRPGLDHFRSHGRVKLKERVDPTSVEVGWMISNAQGYVYQASLLPGDLTDRGREFFFQDVAAPFGDGIRSGLYKVRLQINSRNTLYYWVKAYGDLSAATDANMTIQMHVGDQWFGLSHPWVETGRGWYLVQ